MRKVLLMLTLCLVGISVADSQSIADESSVESELGFVYKEGSFKIGKEKYYYAGIYTADGKICVKFNYSVLEGRDVTANAVAPGTEVLAATEIHTMRGDLFLPKSLKKIYTKFLSVRNALIYDDKAIAEHVVLK
jgi:hypothetical protein